MKVSFTYNTSRTTHSQVLGVGEIEIERCFQVAAEVVGDGEVDTVNLLDVYCQETHHFPAGEIVFERVEIFMKNTPSFIWQQLEIEAIDRANLCMGCQESELSATL